MSKILDYKVLIIIILLLLLYITNCNNSNEEGQTVIIDNKKYTTLKYKVDTFTTIKTKTETKKGDDVYHEKIYIDTEYLYKDVDTANILIEFFTKVVFKDTLTLPDSVGFVFLIDTISQNRLQTRTYTMKFKEVKIREATIVKEPDKNQYFLGMDASFNKTTLINSVGGSILLQSKKDKNLYQISTGLSLMNGGVVPYVGTGIYFKINK